MGHSLPQRKDVSFQVLKLLQRMHENLCKLNQKETNDKDIAR